ncbi:hypothetical protein [Rhodococcus erythropolis]|nr:hypothetical protein [Rhodococcus erythropolis]
MLTEASCHVPIEVPRDREGPFELQFVRRR